MPKTRMPAGDDDYDRVARAIEFIRAQRDGQPSLASVAASLGLSEFHCQRLFSRWAGISPKRFLQVLTLDHAKTLLARSSDLLSASHETGLSGPGRLHDLFVTLEAVTPGEFKAGGSGLVIAHGFHATPLGHCLVAVTDRGLCGLEFADGSADQAAALARLRRQWPSARLTDDPDKTAPFAERIFARTGSVEDRPFEAARVHAGADRRSRSPGPPPVRQPLSVLVRGTNFQVQVWRALLAIPSGGAISYAGLASRIGRPRAVRAAASAVGANPVAYLIPCHRVLRSGGGLGGYRWGLTRKIAALAFDERGSHDLHES